MGKEKFRKLNLKLKKDPKFLENKSRKLFFGDISGGELLGLLGGLGGLYAMNDGKQHFKTQVQRLNQQDRY